MSGNWWQREKILWKQYLIKHRLWFTFLAIFAFVLLGTKTAQTDAEMKGMPVGVYAADTAGKELFASLEEQDGIFRFCFYEEEEEMLRDVKNGTLECGYVLPEDFFEHLLQGKVRRQIPLYYSASSGAHKLSYEVVFSHLFDMLSEDILEKWLLQSGLCEEGELQKQLTRLRELQEHYEQGEETFSFTFEKVGNQKKDEEANLDIVRGIAAVMIYFLSLLGMGNSKELRDRSGMLSRLQSVRMASRSRHIAIAGSVLAGGVFLLVAHGFKEPAKELAALVLFLLLLEVHAGLLGCLLRSAQTVYSAIPVLVLASLLVCPVFFRIETWIPAMEYVGKLFPVTWYLNFFA